MVCRQRTGYLDIQSTDGTREFTVDWGGPFSVASARLNPQMDLLAVIDSRGAEAFSQQHRMQPRSRRAWLAELATGDLRVLPLNDAQQISWAPDGDRLLYTRPGELGSWDLESETATVLTRLPSHARAPEAPSFSPDGRRVAHLRYRGGSYQLAVMELSTRHESVAPRSSFAYDWWDDHAVLQDSPSGIWLLDLQTSMEVLAGRPARFPELKGLIEKRWPLWIESMEQHPHRAKMSIRQPVMGDERLYVRLTLPADAPAGSGLRFLEYDVLASVSRDFCDPRIHFGPEPARIRYHNLVDRDGTIAIRLESRPAGASWEAAAQSVWVYAGTNAHLVPEGFAPLPRRVSPLRLAEYPLGS